MLQVIKTNGKTRIVHFGKNEHDIVFSESIELDRKEAEDLAEMLPRQYKCACGCGMNTDLPESEQ